MAKTIILTFAVVVWVLAAFTVIMAAHFSDLILLLHSLTLAGLAAVIQSLLKDMK